MRMSMLKLENIQAGYGNIVAIKDAELPFLGAKRNHYMMPK